MSETIPERVAVECSQNTAAKPACETEAGLSEAASNSLLLQQISVSEVVEKHGPHLRLYLSRYLRSPHDVEDLLQELYCRLADYSDLAKVESIKAFVFTIASNLLRDRARRSYTQAAKRSVSLDTIEIPVETSDPERIIGDRDALERANRVIDRLQPNCRKAFLLHRIEGFSYKEIALHMGITVSMVEKHIIEALKQLRRGVGG